MMLDDRQRTQTEMLRRAFMMMDKEQLKEVNDALRDAWRAAERRVTAQIRYGDWVQFPLRSGRQVTCRVIRVNSRTVSVNGAWTGRVSSSMCKVVPAPKLPGLTGSPFASAHV
jgi:hypothetical protein